MMKKPVNKATLQPGTADPSPGQPETDIFKFILYPPPRIEHKPIIEGFYIMGTEACNL